MLSISCTPWQLSFFPFQEFDTLILLGYKMTSAKDVEKENDSVMDCMFVFPSNSYVQPYP